MSGPSLAERVTAVTERLDAQVGLLKDLRKQIDAQAADQRRRDAEISARVDALAQELTARKEFSRGFKSGVAMFWVLLGSTIATAANKLIAIIYGGGP